MEGPRGVTGDELPLLDELLAEALGVAATPVLPAGLILRGHSPEQTCRRVRAIFAAGRMLSAVAYTTDRILLDGCRIPVARLGGPVTCPDCREQGLATLLLDDCLGLLRREGIRAVFAPEDRGLYRRFGFHRAGIVWRAILGEGELPPAGQAALRVAETVEAAPDLEELYAREDPRFLPGCETAGRAGAGIPFRAGRICLALREGLLEAYAVVEMEASSTLGAIREYAGERKALAGIMRAIVRRFGLAGLELVLPGGDRPFLERLRMAGGEWAAETMPGSVNLLDPAGLWLDIRPRLARLAGASAAGRTAVSPGEDGAFGITLGQEALVLQDRERLLALFFGRGASPWPDRPLPANLQRVLAACFPLPLPICPVC